MANNEIADFIETVEGEGGWYWRAVSSNGKRVAIGGEPFDSDSNARRAGQDLFPNAEYRETVEESK